MRTTSAAGRAGRGWWLAAMLAMSGVAAGVQAAAATTEVNVISFGARGDGVTDDGPAFRAAQAAVTAAGGGTVMVPRRERGYVIGDGNARGTAIAVTSNTRWVGEGAKLIHRAKSTAGRNHLFSVIDASNVTIKGFEIDGEGRTRVGVHLFGVIRDAVLEDLWLHDLRNFAIAYGGQDTGPDTAYFRNVRVERVKVDGAVGPTGDGSGINFFPRSQREGAPVSTGLQLIDIFVDVTQGQRQSRNHGPQGIKINNTDGVVLRNIRLRGGRSAGLTLTNGTRNVEGRGIEVFGASRGIQISSNNNVVKTATQRIRLAEVKVALSDAGGEWLTDGDRIGMLVWRAPQQVSLSGVSLEGDFVIRARYPTDAINGMDLANLTIREGNFVVEDTRERAAPVTGLRVERLALLGGKGNRGRVLLGGAGRAVSQSEFRGVTASLRRGPAITVFGDGNLFENVSMEETDSRRGAPGPVLCDAGRDNQLRGGKASAGRVAAVSKGPCEGARATRVEKRDAEDD